MSPNFKDGFVLHMLEETEDKSQAPLCLDGTLGGFYHRPGNSRNAKNWIVHFEGGGWCTDEEDCFQRSASVIGSSKAWLKESLDQDLDNGANGWMSNDAAVNPYFHDWTMVHINYCDGASYAGGVGHPVIVHGKPIYFRGARILEQAFKKLLGEMKMSEAETVIITGCSAGGLSVYLHIDQIAEWVKTAARDGNVPRVVGVPDAGFFLDVEDYYGNPNYTPKYKYVAEMQQVAKNLNANCVASQKLKEQWKCFMAPYTAQYIQTDIFVFNSLADTWQLENIVKIPCFVQSKQLRRTDCSPEEWNAVKKFRMDMIAQMTAAGVLGKRAKASTGAWLQTCLTHGEAHSNNIWNGTVVKGQSMHDTLVAWLNDDQSLEKVIVDSEYPSKTSSSQPF